MKTARKAIVLFSHNTHAFILNEIKYASDEFERVIVLCPYSKEIEEEVKKYQNANYAVIRNQKKIISFMNGCKIAKHEAIKDLKKIIKDRKLSKEYLKLLFLYISYTSILQHQIAELLCEYSEEELVVLSMWFAPTAFSTSIIKSKHPKISCVSLAHSFEIDDLKSRYVGYLFKDYCHNSLDLISFISRKVFDQYYNKYIKPNHWRCNNVEIFYIGTQKKLSGTSNKSNDNVIRIVSCSFCVPVKRVDLIYKSLQLIKNREIIWTHIGEGEMYNKLQELIKDTNNNIKCVLAGMMSNNEVHKFYVDNYVDLFINLSAAEGIPVTLMEASAYGIPLIATDVGGNAEIVNAQNGILLSASPKPIEVANAIMDIVNSLNYDDYRQNALVQFQEVFDAEKLRPSFYRKLKSNNLY